MFFKIISIIFLVAILISWLFKSILRFFAKRLLKKINNGDFTQNQENRNNKTSMNKGPRDKKINENVGEYVDYEEL